MCIMLENILLILFGAIIGIVGGFGAQYVHTKIWLSEDIKKTKSLLLSELYGMYNILKFEEEHFTVLLKNSRREFKAICELQKPVNEVPTIFDIVRLRFLTWETLISSGALFKLDENDMKILQTAQQNIRKHDSDMNNLRKQCEVTFKNHVQRFGYARLISDEHDLLNPYFDECRNVVGRTLIIFEKDLDKLTWFDHKKIPQENGDVARYGQFS